MKKKSIYKVLFLSIFILFALTLSASAKTMTVDELGEELDKIENETDTLIDSYYVIGNYVYTSRYIINTRDIMFASRSIEMKNKQEINTENKDNLLSEMTIHQVQRDFATNGWKILNNYVGETELTKDTQLNIRYIDYEYVSDDTKVEVSLDGINTEKFNSKFTNNAENLVLEGAENEKKLSGMIELNDKVDTSIFTDSSYLTKHYFAFKLKVNNEITDQTTVKITYPDGKVDSYTGKSKFDDASQGIMTILAHLDSSKNPKDQIITIEVDLDGDGKLYSTTKYTIDCSEVTFQEKSKATDNEIASLSNISESDKNILQNEWKYDLSNIGNDIKLVKGDDGNYTLTGDIKQQTLADGIFKEKQGYYIPVKIFGPKDISSSNWNIQVHDETETEPNWLTRTPDSTDYTNNYMVILFKIKEDGDKITYKIDWDGNENKYLPIEVTIDYSSLTFLKQHSIKFKYNNKETNVTVWDNEKIATDKIPTTEEYAYHEFVYWQENEDSAGAKVDLTTKTFDKDIVLVPHWKLLADDFIDSEISKVNTPSDKNFELALEKASNTITVCTDKQNVNLNELTKTSLSDAIYNVLQKGEIKSIDIELEQTKTFTKSNDLQNIKETLNALFDSKTLDQLAIDNTTIKIKLTAENTVDLEDTEYTLNFKFVSDTMVVKNEAELKQALKLSMIKNILIDNDIQLTEENKDSKHTHTLFINIDDPNRKVTIKSKDDSNFITIIDNDVTTEGDGDVTPVIQVDKGNVTFENLKIKGATRAISVKSGATVTAKNVNAIGSQDAGFDVAEGATFNATDLKYTTDGTQNKESYHYPTVCGRGTVNITNGATKVENYKRIVAMKDSSAWTDNDFRDPETGKYYPEFVEPGTEKLKDEWQQHIDNGDIRGEHSDSLSTTNHTHYYLDGANSKYYEVYFWDSRVRLIIFKYYGINDEIVPPKDNVYKQSDKATDFHFFIKAYVDAGKSTAHVHDGWVNQSGEKVDKFKVSGDPTKAEVYYTRFVDGYRVTLPIKVNGTDKTGVFGIVKDTGEMKIKDLIDSDPDFAKYYQELKIQAAGKKIVEKNDQTKEVDENTVIDKNMDLIIVDA